MLLTLLDGTTVFVRPIAPEDKPLLQRFITQISPETAYRRFMSPKSSFTAAELRYLTEVDGREHAALVAVTPDNTLAGVARYVRADPSSDTADMAIVVADRWQRMGLGRRLARALADRAAAVGIERFAGTMLADNGAALRIMRGVGSGFEVDVLEHGVREIVTRLAA